MARSRRSAVSRPSPSVMTSSRRPASTTTQPAPTQTAPPPAMQQSSSSGGGMLSGIGSTIAQGMAFGTGSAIAHRAVGAVANSFGGGSESAQPQQQQQQQPQQVSRMNDDLQGACAQDKQMFFECLKVNQGDQQSCSFLYQTLQECQRNQSQMSFQ